MAGAVSRARHGAAPVGSLGEETSRLFEALQNTLGEVSGDVPDACDHERPAACRICPVCQVVHRLTHVRPEVVKHLADATAALAAALSELAREPSRGEHREGPAATGPRHAAAPPTDGSERGPRAGVQRIDITD